MMDGRKGKTPIHPLPCHTTFIVRLKRTFVPLRRLSHRKEVIQPHLPVRLPCYDFTLLTRRTFDVDPLRRLV